jgi:hypothetical protein
MTEHIDVTPTWEEILPAIRAALENSKSPSVIESMWDELMRCARQADELNAMIKEVA